MDASQVFSIVNTMVLPMWGLMILLPRWKGTRFLCDFKIIPLVLSVIYAIYIFLSVQNGGGMDFSSLESVMQLFTAEQAVLAGWVHYLAFDLIVGMWILDQNKEYKIPHWLIVPCLIGSFMLGPIGFLLFMILRTVKTNKS